MIRYFFLGIFLFLQIQTQAQTALEHPVTLRLTDVPITTALLQLSEAANVNITFSPQLFPQSRFINAKLNAVPLRAILQQWLGATEVGFRWQDQGIILFQKKPQRFTVSGYLTDAETGERLVGANIYETNTRAGIASNTYGFYSQQFKQGQLQLEISYLGYQTRSIDLNLQKNTTLSIELSPALMLNEVVIIAKEDSTTMLSTNTATTLPLKWLERLPTTAGESDVMRYLQLLPGVQSGADGFGGLHVRGGNSDQNLILLDDVPIYNPSHTFGLFSIFNPDLVKNVQFYKDGFPARYDSRISSVVDIRTREGSEKTVTGSVSLGTIAARGLLELPFKNEKGGILVAGRHSHVNWWLKPISAQQKAAKNLNGEMDYNFADFNIKSHYNLGLQDKIYASVYWGKDNFTDFSTTITDLFAVEEGELENELEEGDILYFKDDNYGMEWGNQIFSLRWNHLYNDKIFSNTTATLSNFNYQSIREYNEEAIVFGEDFLAQRTGEFYSSNIIDYSLRTDFDYFINPQHHLRFGVSWSHRQFTPGLSELSQTGNDLDSIPEFFLSNIEYNEALKTTEYSLYMEDEFKQNHWTINIGGRFSLVSNEGFNAPTLQPRLAIHYYPHKYLQWNATAARTVQSLHLLTRSDAGLPNDLWVAASENIPQQKAWQLASSIAGQMDAKRRWRIAGYWKKMDNLYRILPSDLQSGVTSLEELQIDATNWESFVEGGHGQSAGIEVMLEQQTERWIAWGSYAFAKTTREFGQVTTPYSFDTRHSFTFATTLQLTSWLDFSLNAIFQSGRPYSVTDFGENDVPFLDVLNTIRLNSKQQRLPVYSRLDMNLNIQLSKKKIAQQLQLGVYNALNRKNVLFAYGILNDETGTYATHAAYGLPILPSISYKVSW